MQAYGKRARAVIGWADMLAQATGRRLAVRLVKGAYWDSEIKRAQEAGLAGELFRNTLSEAETVHYFDLTEQCRRAAEG